MILDLSTLCYKMFDYRSQQILHHIPICAVSRLIFMYHRPQGHTSTDPKTLNTRIALAI
jgi:hypothetical protein